MCICSETLNFILYPVSLVDITARMDEFTLTMRLSLLPLSIVLRTVGPYERTSTQYDEDKHTLLMPLPVL